MRHGGAKMLRWGPWQPGESSWYGVGWVLGAGEGGQKGQWERGSERKSGRGGGEKEQRSGALCLYS